MRKLALMLMLVALAGCSDDSGTADEPTTEPDDTPTDSEETPTEPEVPAEPPEDTHIEDSGSVMNGAYDETFEFTIEEAGQGSILVKASPSNGLPTGPGPTWNYELTGGGLDDDTGCDSGSDTSVSVSNLSPDTTLYEKILGTPGDYTFRACIGQAPADFALTIDVVY